MNALWFGQQKDGSISGGTTPVSIEGTVGAASTDFRVELQELRDAGAGPMWTAATSNAAAWAVLSAGEDPSTIRLSYSLDESIDGPSAGALLALGSRTSLDAGTTFGDATLTGTILPDGSVGPVGGIPEKIRAASTAGIKKVLIPATQTMATDPRTGQLVDVTEVGKGLGVEVRPVATVWDAMGIVATPPAAVARGEVPALDQPLVASVETSTRQLIETTAAALAEAPDTSRSRMPTGTKTRASESLTSARAQLAVGDVFAAYAAAGRAAEDLTELEAQQTVTSSLRTESVEAVNKDLVAQIEVQAQRAVDAVITVSQTAPTSMEQLIAFADVMSWATDAYASLASARESLSDARSTSGVVLAAEQLASATLDIDEFMPAAARAMQSVSGRPLADAGSAADLLENYAQFLAYAADSNATYSTDVLDTAKAGSKEAKRVADVKSVWDSAPRLAESLEPLQGSALMLAAATSYYVTTSAFAAQVASAGVGDDLYLRDSELLSRLVTTAAETAAGQAEIAAGSNLNSSYLRWNSAWGQDSATNAGSDASQRLVGLESQWLTNVGYQILEALEKDQHAD